MDADKKTSDEKKKTAKKEKTELKSKAENQEKRVRSATTKKEEQPQEEDKKKQATEEKLKKPERFFEAVGRRKTSIARVRLFTKPGDFYINEKNFSDYFATVDLQRIAGDSLQKMKLFGRFKISARIQGGGIHSQAEALRHGLARCLIKFNPDFRKRLKRAGFLKRDPRMRERKKFGLKKARRAPQWQKR